MSLKVFLADDSPAIKKVVQISLQDFGVELKSISSGKDAFDLARSFKPDIAFIDVLLPQKSGYEVASEIKKSPELKSTAVVMLWSAFMAFDESKFRGCGADERLEKPFEMKTLRDLVQRLVPQTKKKAAGVPPIPAVEQPIGSVPPQRPKMSGTSPHTAPSLPKIELPPIPGKKPAGPSAKATPVPVPVPVPVSVPAPPTTPKEKNSGDDWSMSNFEDIQSFSQRLTEKKSSDPFRTESQSVSIVIQEDEILDDDKTPSISEGDWERKDLGRFKVSMPKDVKSDSIDLSYAEADIKDDNFLFKPHQSSNVSGSLFEPLDDIPSSSHIDFAALDLEGKESAKKNSSPKNSAAANATPSSLSPEALDLISDQTREVIERAVWKLVPEIASQIIRDELQRLLQEDS